MTFENSCRRSACSTWGIIISVIFAAAVGILYGMGNVPNIETSVWIAFGLGVLTLVFEFVGVDLASINPETSLYKCLYNEINCLLVGSVGTIVSSLVLLSITLTTTILVDVLVAIDAFFFAEMVIGWIVLLDCVVHRRARED